MEARRRRQTPAFGRLSRAAAVALAARSLEPLLPAVIAENADDAVFFARIHGISGLLDSLADARVPATVAEAWRADRARVGARAARFRDDLDRLRRRASEAGLAFHPLKGALLAFGKYPDPSLRPAADIDLLAEEPDFEAWSRILVEEGYFAQTESPDVRVFFRTDFRTPDSFEEHPDNPRPVELHRRVAYRLLGRRVDLTERYLTDPDRDRALFLHLLVHAGPALVGRGLRLVQFEDFRHVSADADSARSAVALLHDAAWGISALIERTLPGTFTAAYLDALAPPSARRQRLWLARPGLVTGEAEREVLFLAEARLCRTPRELLSRCVDAFPETSFLDRAYGASPLRLLRYYRDRFSPR